MYTVVAINDELNVAQVDFDSLSDAKECEVKLLNQGFTTSILGTQPMTSNSVLVEDNLPF